MSVPSQRDAARLLKYRLNRVIIVPVVCAYARESVAGKGARAASNG